MEPPGYWDVFREFNKLDFASLGGGFCTFARHCRLPKLTTVSKRFKASVGARVQALRKRFGRAGTAPAFKSFTERSFCENLMKRTGNAPPDSHAHHIFPKEFADEFAALGGINVHDPRFGAWSRSGPHLDAHRRGYNLEWRRILNDRPSPDALLAEGRRMARDYGLKPGF